MAKVQKAPEKNLQVSLAGKNSQVSLAGKNSQVSLAGKSSQVSLSGKKSTKDTAKELPKKAALKETKPTPVKSEPIKTAAPQAEAPKAVAAKPVVAAPAKAAAKEPEQKAAAKPVEVIQVRAHEDAKLTKAEMTQLHAMLIEEKNRVLQNFETHVGDALSDEDILADEMDIAQRSTDQASFFRMADKDRKLLIEIDVAMEKMKNGEYGLCEGTDEPIGFKRLEIRPWTRYSVAYKELLEREKAQQAR